MATERTLRANIRLIDNYTRPMRTVVTQTNLYKAAAAKIKPVIAKAKDMASKVLTPIKAKIDALKAIPQVQTILKAVDMASKVASKVFSGLKKIGGMVVSATVKVLDKASSMLSGIAGKLSALAGGVTIGVAVKMGVNELASEQTQKLTISRVIENSGQSKADAQKATEEYYKYLEDYANKTPFETSAVAQFGTKAMMMSKGNVDNAKQYTDAMGNVKAFVGDLRTETEVAEAFFSASNGNMDMLNNMLGEQYKTMDEAMAGIQKKQGGLVEDMSGTIGGLMSTITGKAKVGLKNFVKVFEEPLTNALNGVIGFIDQVSPMMEAFAGRIAGIDFGALFSSFDFSTVITALQPVIDLWNSFFTAIETKSPAAMGWMNILGTVFNTVWTMIGAVIQAVTPTIQAIFTFIGQHSTQISAVVKALGAVWNAVWNTVGTLLKAAWSICEPILSFLLKALEKVSSAVQGICDWWNKMVSALSKPIDAVINVFKKDKGTKSEGNNAFGSGRIARDGTMRTLHEGEKVLTKRETDSYLRGQSSPSVVINMNGATIREEADIDKIARSLVKKLNQNKINYGGVY